MDRSGPQPNLNWYMYCFVPSCKNTTSTTPEKLFIQVPSNVLKRKNWCNAVGFDKNKKLKKTSYCCEDHLDLENDLKNYNEYMQFGGRKILKENVVPRFNLNILNNPGRSTMNNETFRDSNKIIEKEHGIMMNLSDLQNDNIMDLDQNIEFCTNKVKTEVEHASDSSLLNEELLEKDPELIEDFHAVIESIKCEERQIKKEFETVDTIPDILNDNNQDPKSEQSLKFSEIIYKPIKDRTTLLLCRLCASQCTDTVYMFEGNRTYRNIIEKIERCLPIVVRETDTLPKQACHSCLKMLEYCYKFYKSVQVAEKQLTMLGRKVSDEFWETDKHYQTSLLYNDQYDSKKGERELKTSKEKEEEEDANNNQSTSTASEEQILNPTAESRASLSKSMLYAREIIPSNINGDLNTDSLVENNLKEDLRIDKEITTSKLYSPSIMKNDQFSDNFKTKDTDKDIADDTLADYSLVRRMIRCQVCGKLFRTAAKCDLHSTIHALENYYPCSLCDKTFTILKDWNEHRLDHLQSEEFKSRSANYVCDECGKKFLTETKLQFHKFNHTSDVKQPYCKKCDKLMDSEAALYQHKLTLHRQDKDHCCDICGKQFRSEFQLNGHKGKHTEKRIKESFSCAHCEKTFEQKWSLIIHIRSHTGERPFKCDLCDKSYKTKAQRNSHRRTHTGEKPFKCPTCGKKFAQALRLSEHANVHTVTRPYKCSLCDKSFKRIHARTIHMTTHTGEKLYQCDVCDKKFRWPSAIRRHKKDQHRMK